MRILTEESNTRTLGETFDRPISRVLIEEIVVTQLGPVELGDDETEQVVYHYRPKTVRFVDPYVKSHIDSYIFYQSLTKRFVY